MKNLKLFSFLIIASSLLFVQCTSDPIPGPAGADGADGSDGTDGVSTGPGTSPTELLVQKVFLGPVVDGVIDASWTNAQQLIVETEVPDPGDNVFQGYVGNKHDVVVRAQYDSDYIYFLAEWKDAQQDASRDTWYFDPAQLATNAGWAQESNKPVFDGAGVKTREAFYEDKFAMQWDINNTTTDWASNTCYATCHTGLGSPNFAKHYTIAAGEQTDMWHWKSVRTGLPTGQFDDKHVTDTPQSDARHGDAKVSGGHSNNKQTVALLDGTFADVTIPKYFIPNRDNYYWILVDEVNDGTAKLIKGAYTNGDLEYYDNGTSGSTSILTPGADFERDATTLNHIPALKGMPSITTTAFVGSRGDISCGQTYTGNGWILEWKRKLNTGNSDDVTFDPTQEYPFGLATFDNSAIAHGIKAFLNLKFEQ
jgi:Ethylbenzene dehydrogenase